MLSDVQISDIHCTCVKVIDEVPTKTSNNTRYEQNDWHWSEGSGVRESLSFKIKPMGVPYKK
jgi:hypothetical protein